MAEWSMTLPALKKLAKDQGGYGSRTDLNEVLYLQCKGICTLENLEYFSGLKALYLESNAIEDLEPLNQCPELRNLFLAKNLIREVSGLNGLRKLVSLDISDNQVESLQGISNLVSLEQLVASNNRLAESGDLLELLECRSLRSLDLSGNKVDDEGAVELLERMPLRLLKFSGNPVVNRIRPYRKRLLATMPSLEYFDDSPAFEHERRAARGYMWGGLEGERREREAFKQEQKEKQEQHRRDFDAMVERAKERAAQQANEPNARFRFKTEEAAEELKLIEKGMSEVKAREYLDRKRNEKSESEVNANSNEDEDPGIIQWHSPTQGSSDNEYATAEEESIPRDSPSEVSEWRDGNGGESPKGEQHDEGLTEDWRNRVEVITDLRQEFRTNAAERSRRMPAEFRDQYAQRAERRKGGMNFHEAQLEKREAWRLARAWQEVKREKGEEEEASHDGQEQRDSLPGESRPLLFGTERYEQLWQMAKALNESESSPEHNCANGDVYSNGMAESDEGTQSADLALDDLD